jgi:ABC-type nickel/cobalt efflux system permease component RcnA
LNSRARLSLAALVCGALLACAGLAAAHPAGFTSVNRYIGVQCDSERQVRIAYLLDFAELPAYAEIEQLDADHDGTVTPEEQRAYLDRRLPPLVAAWRVQIDGLRASPRVTASSLEVSPGGERGLSTLRIAADVVVDRGRQAPGDPEGGEVSVTIEDRTFSDHPGWRELAAEESAAAPVVSGPTARSTDALTYRADSLASPPRSDEARFVFRVLQSAGASAARAPFAPAVAIDARLSRWSLALKRADGSAVFSALAMALAFGLGAAHALSPGHGKALAAAYLVGSRARPSQAVLLGATVTVAHTIIVFLLGCLALTVERTVGSERLLRGLELVSAVLVLGLGVVQLSRRLREAATSGGAHAHPLAVGPPQGLRSLVLLGASAGVTPCPSALALLLAAIALGRYAFGLILVLAFSSGVAVTLTATGLLVVLARRLLDRFSAAGGRGPLVRWLPVVSSACVLVLGVLLCASAASAWPPTDAPGAAPRFAPPLSTQWRLPLRSP